MKAKEKAKARELRKQGCSVKEIATKVKVARSSVSRWVRDIELTEQQKQILADRNKCSKGQNNGAMTNKLKAQERHKKYKQSGLEWAEQDETFRLICALYWGEGNKNSKRVGLSNSDADMIVVFVKWLRDIGYSFTFSVQYYGENGLSEKQILQWWQKKVPLIKKENIRKFTRCKLNRASQRKKIGALPYGTARIEATKSTDLFFKIVGGINRLKKGDW